MNIDIKDVTQIAFDLKKINRNLEYLTKQLDKNKIKYPLGMTYDQLASNILLVAGPKEAEREFKIVRIT